MENHVDTKYGVEVVGFSNEEGATVGSGLLGSRYFVEGIDKKEMEMLEPIVVGAGLSGISECKGCKAFDRSVYEFYVELHVEQGGVLDGEGYQIGVVQGIVGIHTYDFRFIGVSNHAGTTPMNQRRDALLGAANLIASIPKSVSDYGSGTTVGTCGQVAVYPGARNVIPGRVHLSVEVRDLQSEVADRVVEHLKKEADSLADAYGLRSETDPVSISQPAIMDARIQEIIRAVAEDLGLRAKAMPSGAGHDAAIFAKYVPTGMIFVPSKDGISHSPDEWTDPLDCINGANILLNTVLTLAK
jgi:N-carbamoyl-L-amino-acid hydrolase